MTAVQRGVQLLSAAQRGVEPMSAAQRGVELLRAAQLGEGRVYGVMGCLCRMWSLKEALEYRLVSKKMKKVIEDRFLLGDNIDLNEYKYHLLTRLEWFGSCLLRSGPKVKDLRLRAQYEKRINLLANRLLTMTLWELEMCILRVDLFPAEDFQSTRASTTIGANVPIMTMPNLIHLDVMDCTFPNDPIKLNAPNLQVIVIKAKHINQLHHPIIDKALSLHRKDIEQAAQDDNALIIGSTTEIVPNCLVRISDLKPYCPGKTNDSVNNANNNAITSTTNAHTSKLSTLKKAFTLKREQRNNATNTVAIENQSSGTAALDDTTVAIYPRTVCLMSCEKREDGEVNLEQMNDYIELRKSNSVPGIVDRVIREHPTISRVLMNSTPAARETWRKVRDLDESVPDWLEVVPIPYPSAGKDTEYCSWAPPDELPEGGVVAYKMDGIIIDPDRESQKSVVCEIYWRSLGCMETMFDLMTYCDPIHPRCLVTIVLDEFESWVLEVDWKRLISHHNVQYVFFRQYIPSLQQLFSLYLLFHQLSLECGDECLIPSLCCFGIPVVPEPWTQFVFELVTGQYDPNAIEKLIKLCPPNTRHKLNQLRQQRQPQLRSYLFQLICVQLQIVQDQNFRLGSLSTTQLTAYKQFYNRLKQTLSSTERGVTFHPHLQLPRFTMYCPTSSPWYISKILNKDFHTLRSWGIWIYKIPFGPWRPTSAMEREAQRQQAAAARKAAQPAAAQPPAAAADPKEEVPKVPPSPLLTLVKYDKNKKDSIAFYEHYLSVKDHLAPPPQEVTYSRRTRLGFGIGVNFFRSRSTKQTATNLRRGMPILDAIWLSGEYDWPTDTTANKEEKDQAAHNKHTHHAAAENLRASSIDISEETALQTIPEAAFCLFRWGTKRETIERRYY